jgi:molybdenum cofactor cytidylyltransferase
MGAVNKLLLPVSGVPLVRHMTLVLQASRVRELVVVLGHEANLVENALSGLQVKTVRNAHFIEGQMTSVHAGMDGLTQESDGVMVCLSDQPLLTIKDINHLIDVFYMRKDAEVIVPTYRGRRGNPIVLASEHRKSILSGQRNLGCKNLIEKNPDIVTTVEWDTDHVVVDIDTRDDVINVDSTRRTMAAGTNTG